MAIVEVAGRCNVTVRLHVAALGYAVVAALVVLEAEARAGLRLSTYFGSYYPQEIVYPLAFWALTAIYALVATWDGGGRLGPVMASAVPMGLLVHLGLLAMTFEDDAAALRLTGYFHQYATTVVAAVGVVVLTLGFLALLALRRGELDGVWLPLVYLPGVQVLFGWPARTALLLAISGLLALLTWRVRTSDRGQRLAGALSRLVRGDLVFAAFLLVLSLLFRVLAAQRLVNMGLETVLLNADDATQYDLNARALLQGQFVSTSYSAGYSAVTAFLYWLGGSHVPSVLILQALISATVPVAVWLIGRRTFGEATGRAGALLAALSQLLIYNAVNLAREMASIVLAAWGVVLLLGLADPAKRDFRLCRVVLLAMLGGVLISVEPVFAVVSVFLALGFGSARWRLARRQSEITFAVITLTGLVLALLVSRDPVVILAAGLVASVGYHYYPYVGTPSRVGLTAAAILVAWTVAALVNMTVTGEFSTVTRTKTYAIHVSKDFNPYAQELLNRGVNVFAHGAGSIVNFFDRPLVNAALIGQKISLDLRRFFFEGNTGLFDPLFLANGSFFAANLTCYAIVFGMLGLAAAGREMVAGERAPEKAIVLGVLGIYATAYIVLFFGMTRFRATVQPLLLLAVAHGLVVTLRSLRLSGGRLGWLTK